MSEEPIQQRYAKEFQALLELYGYPQTKQPTPSEPSLLDLEPALPTDVIDTLSAVCSPNTLEPPASPAWNLVEIPDGEHPVVRIYRDPVALARRLHALQEQDVYARVFYGVPIQFTEKDTNDKRYLCLAPGEYLSIAKSPKPAVDISLPFCDSGWLGDAAMHPDAGSPFSLTPLKEHPQEPTDLGHYPGRNYSRPEAGPPPDAVFDVSEDDWSAPPDFLQDFDDEEEESDDT